MRKLLILMAGVLMPFMSMAQNPDSTTLVVDVTVKRAEVTPGVYAQYAKKMLGIEVSTLKHLVHPGVEADICDAVTAKEPSVQRPHWGFEEEDVLPVDRMGVKDTTDLATRAARAADMIFSVRQSRMDLITGDAGEYVFGAGLPEALKRLDRMERELLQLFTGKRVRSIETRRFEFTPTPDATSERVVFDGVEIEVTYEPEQVEKLASVAPRKGATPVMQRIAVPTRCTVKSGDNVLIQKTIPMLQFGYDVAR